MSKVVGVLLAWSLLASSLVLAGEFQLERKKIPLTPKNAEILPEIELRPQILPETVTEPRYRSRTAQKFFARFGGSAGETESGDGGIGVAFAVDEREGTGEGFDCLIVDTAGSGQLTSGRRLVGKALPRGWSFVDTSFPPFDIAIPGPDSTLDYPIAARFSIERNATGNSTLYLTPLCYLEGKVELGGKKQTLLVFDANCNGIFGERLTGTRAPVGGVGFAGAPSGAAPGAAPSGDKIWIGTGTPRGDAAYTEALPLGRYFLFEDAYYEITIDEKDLASVVKADVPLGTVKVGNPGFVLELVSRDGVLYASNEKGQEIIVPVGSYQLKTASFRQRFRGSIWELEGEPGACNKSVTITEGTTTAVDVGPPLRIVVTTTMTPQGTGTVAYHDFRIEGGYGEKYKYLRKDGRKVDLPEIFVRSPGNKVVKKGQFEYG
ncbi:MAG: hypothetical protein AB1486_01475 [Planctomycetota bacterium]